MNRDNKAAFVTGAGGYIGGTIARMLAAQGVSVAVCDVNEQAVHHTVDAITREGGCALGITADITRSQQTDDAVKKTVAAFGTLDVMVHAAGGSARSRMKPLIEQTDDVIDDVIGVNLFGGIRVSRAASREMVRLGKPGRIIQISSVVAMNGLCGCVDYAAAKGGLIAMTRSLAKELAPYGITANTVAPGVVQRPGETNEAISTNFLGKKCTAEDVAGVVLFLTSDSARFITGQTYVVDGGRGLAMKGTDV